VQGRTRDHTRVEALIAQGLLDPGAARTHPDRNKLFNCLGAPGVPSIDMSEPTRLEAGDVILLCSDGLWNALPDEAMALHLAAEGVVRAVPKLVRQAEAAAGDSSDNVTALAMMWDDAHPAQGEAGVITTALVPLGAVTTTIHAPRHGEPETAESMDSFNDGDIEQAIAEIRDAIERTSRLTSKP
jgi:protein phosphatase